MTKFFHEKIKITGRSEEASGIYCLKFNSAAISSKVLPGQFLQLRIEGKTLRRPISIFSCHGEELQIAFKVRGKGTAILSSMEPGAYIDVLGPLGSPFPLDNGRPLFVAGGIGAAPLNFLASKTATRGVFIYGTADGSEALKLSGVESSGHRIVPVSEKTDSKLATDLMSSYIADSDIVYAAGPKAMLKTAAKICMENSKKGYISWEERMGCGFGVCLSCAVKTVKGYKRTCMEGPVFSIEELDWDDC
ncbi:MAG: FAD-binding oxidoreductase [Elusimicrobiota bacterium]